MEQKACAQNSTFTRTLGNGEWRRCFCAFTLLFLSIWLLNRFVFPAYTIVCPLARESSTAASGLTMMAIAFIALVRPAKITKAAFAGISISSYIAGLTMVAAALQASLPWLLVVGGILLSVGRSLFEICIAVLLLDMDSRPCAICIACACAASYLLKSVFLFTSVSVGMTAFAIAPPFMLYLVWPYASRFIERAHLALPAADLSLVQPKAFLPFSHTLFVSLFVFRAAFGFSLTFNMSNGIPPLALLSFIPIAIVALLSIISKAVHSADTLYEITALLILAGLIVVPLPQLSETSAANILMAAGADCFSVLLYYLLAAVGRRNPAQALPVLGWGLFASSIGTLIGTSSGHILTALNGSDMATGQLACAIVLFAYVAYNILVLRNFSFEETVRGIERAQVIQPASASVSADADSMDRRCAIVVEAFSLTEREIDVLALLARGRNVPFIQEELVISRNTIKTHIKHIYQKLGVHSQQELIDMVETY